jgi:rod shape determining protein RodA
MRLLFKINYALVIVPLMLFTLGVVTLFASSPDKARSQLLFLLIGIIFYFAALFFDYTITKSFWKHFLVFCTILLVFVQFLGVTKLGSARWLDIGIVTFQPSELAKVCLIFTLAAFISENYDFKQNPIKLLKLIGITFPLIILVFLQPDLGTTIILVSTLLFTLFFSGISKMYFLILLIFGGLLSAPLWHALKEYQKIRVLVFLNPQLDVLGHGYNVIQSVISIGSGGFFGKGFGHGTQTQMNFLPVHWTDFIFASFSEEWGFIGVILLVVLYAILLITILHVVLKTKDPYGSLIAVGIFSVFLVQFTINVGMNLGLMPVTGITLPFVSHGGTSLIVSLGMLGLLQNIWIKEH